jgi:TRAP-type mannitol/chloroaromatic compound transport system permease small subunit
MLRLAGKLENFIRFTGQLAALLSVVMVAITSVIVVGRYWFETGSISLQESVTFMHAALFMLAAAYTLAAGDHVRVDIFYGQMTAPRRALVDVLGTLLLLLPFCGFLIWSGWEYVEFSWRIREASQEAGGLPFPFPTIMKSFIPVAGLLLGLQGIVIILRSLVTLRSDNGAAQTVEH